MDQRASLAVYLLQAVTILLVAFDIELMIMFN